MAATSPIDDPFEQLAPLDTTSLSLDHPPEYAQVVHYSPSQDPIHNRWSWTPPQSWAVCQGPDDDEYAGSTYSSDGEEDVKDESDDEENEEDYLPDGEKQIERIMTEQCLVKWEIYVHRQDGKVHMCRLPLIATVQDLENRLRSRSPSSSSWKLYLRESDGRERSLYAYSRPALIIKQCLEAAGYVVDPKIGFRQPLRLEGKESGEFGFLPTFVFREPDEKKMVDVDVEENPTGCFSGFKTWFKKRRRYGKIWLK